VIILSETSKEPAVKMAERMRKIMMMRSTGQKKAEEIGL